MDRDLFRFDERYYRPRRKTNWFAWSIVVLLLMGMAMAAWLGSFYIFGQPERPDSYRILQKLHKIDPPRRFELTAAPKGEFLNAQKIYERYSTLRPAELARTNAELVRNFLRNYQQVRGLVPYVVGRYDIMAARELSSADVFTTGMVALTRSAERGELMMEHLYPGDPRDVALMKQTLVVGLEIRLERTHDLSAIIHVERLPDGRLLATAVPLLYGSYTVTRGPGTFNLEPPNELNLAAGWPVYKERQLRKAELHYALFRAKITPALNAGIPIAGVTTSTPPPAANELVRVEPAVAMQTSTPAATIKGKTTPRPAGKKVTQKAARSPTPEPTVITMAVAGTAAPTFSVPPTLAEDSPTPPPVRRALPAPSVASTPAATPSPVPVLPALPVTSAEGNALASTAGGGSWRTFDPGRMPVGRLITPSDLGDVAERGMAGERYYLKGQFVVNFAEGSRAVLRPRSRLSDRIPGFRGSRSARIIVDYPAGYRPPAQGSVVARDDLRPLEITEVRRESDGQINVFAREIIRP